MPFASTVSGIGPPTATSLSGRSSAQTAPMSTKSFLRRTSATSNRFSRSAGTPSSSESSKWEATNDSLTSWRTTSESASQASTTSTRPGLPSTIGECWAFGREAFASRRRSLQRTGPSSSPRRISSTRSLIRPSLPTLSLSMELAPSGMP